MDNQAKGQDVTRSKVSYLSVPIKDIFDSLKGLDIGYLLTDRSGTLLEANDIAAEHLKYPSNTLNGKSYFSLLPEKFRPYAQLYHAELFDKKNERRSEIWELIDQTGTPQRFQMYSSLVESEDQGEYRMDLLMPKDKEDERDDNREILMNDSRHMFKNTLHEINGLIQLQTSHANGAAKQMLEFSYKRNATIAFAFEQLYKYADWKKIELSLYIHRVLTMHRCKSNLAQSGSSHYTLIERAYALGLILNELLCAYKAFISDLKLCLDYQGHFYIMRLVYEGNSLLPTIEGFGLQLINALKKQLNAEDVSDVSQILGLKVKL